MQARELMIHVEHTYNENFELMVGKVENEVLFPTLSLKSLRNSILQVKLKVPQHKTR